MSNLKIRHQIIIGLLLGLFFAIPVTMLYEQGISVPSIEVIEGQDVDATEDLMISQSFYEPQHVVRVLNHSSISPENDWIIEEDRAYTRFAISRGNISEVILGLAITTYDIPISLTLSRSPYYPDNSAIVGINQTTQLTLAIPYESSNDFSTYSVFSEMEASIQISDCSWDDFKVNRFWVDIVTNGALYPVSIDIQTTNGVSFYSNPNMKFLSYDPAPKVGFYSYTLGFYDLLFLNRVNETVFLPIGNYEVLLTWNQNITGTYEVTNTSTSLIWHIKCVQVETNLTQDVEGFFIYFNHYYYYSQHSLLSSPSFYFKPNTSFSATVSSWSPAHSGYAIVNTHIDSGENQNISIKVKPGWVSVGAVSITPGRAIIFCASILFIIAIMLSSGMNLLTNPRILSFLALFVGVFLPWMQVSHIQSYPAPTPPGSYRVVWDICPTLFTSYSSQNGSSLAIAPLDPLYPRIYSIGIGVLLFLLVATMFLGNLSEITGVAELPSLNNTGVTLTFIGILCLEFMLLANGFYRFGTGGIDSYSIEIGSVLTFLSAISWFLLNCHPFQTTQKASDP